MTALRSCESTAGEAPPVILDADELDDDGDARPWTSRRAWGEEMFDRWAA